MHGFSGISITLADLSQNQIRFEMRDIEVGDLFLLRAAHFRTGKTWRDFLKDGFSGFVKASVLFLGDKNTLYINKRSGNII